MYVSENKDMKVTGNSAIYIIQCIVSFYVFLLKRLMRTYPPKMMEVVAKALAELNLLSKGIPGG